MLLSPGRILTHVAAIGVGVIASVVAQAIWLQRALPPEFHSARDNPTDDMWTTRVTAAGNRFILV